MKKHNHFFLKKSSLALFAFLIGFACTGSRQTKGIQPLPTAASVDQYTAKATLKTTQDGNLCVIISENNNRPNQFYVLQTSNQYTINQTKPNAGIIFGGSFLIINDGSTYTLFNLRNDNAYQQYVQGSTPSNMFEGYGLSSNSNSTNYAVAMGASGQNVVPSGLATCNCQNNSFFDSPSPPDCQSGGEGSTSCSQSGTSNISGEPESCTVTCGEGYAACCNIY